MILFGLLVFALLVIGIIVYGYAKLVVVVILWTLAATAIIAPAGTVLGIAIDIGGVKKKRAAAEAAEAEGMIYSKADKPMGYSLKATVPRAIKTVVPSTIQDHEAAVEKLKQEIVQDELQRLRKMAGLEE